VQIAVDETVVSDRPSLHLVYAQLAEGVSGVARLAEQLGSIKPAGREQRLSYRCAQNKSNSPVVRLQTLEEHP
jgi:hypothetical protein